MNRAEPNVPPAASAGAPPAAALPTSAKENIGLLTELYQEEQGATSPAQRAIEAVSTFFGSPAYFVFVLVFVVAWIACNQLGDRFGWNAFDEAPFFWLQGLVALNALLLTVAVLIRQNRMAALAQRRAHLDLQINLLAEHKITKIIQMLKSADIGIDSALPSDGDDVEELTTPADAHAILKAIKHEETTEDAAPPGRTGGTGTT